MTCSLRRILNIHSAESALPTPLSHSLLLPTHLPLIPLSHSLLLPTHLPLAPSSFSSPAVPGSPHAGDRCGAKSLSLLPPEVAPLTEFAQAGMPVLEDWCGVCRHTCRGQRAVETRAWGRSTVMEQEVTSKSQSSRRHVSKNHAPTESLWGLDSTACMRSPRSPFGIDMVTSATHLHWHGSCHRCGAHRRGSADRPRQVVHQRRVRLVSHPCSQNSAPLPSHSTNGGFFVIQGAQRTPPMIMVRGPGSRWNGMRSRWVVGGMGCALGGLCAIFVPPHSHTVAKGLLPVAERLPRHLQVEEAIPGGGSPPS